MNRLQVISDDLLKSLDLKYEPVGVNLYMEGDALPVNTQFAEGKFKSYCQALALAGQGSTLLLTKEQMGC